jgi:hypothetical protein
MSELRCLHDKDYICSSPIRKGMISERECIICYRYSPEYIALKAKKEKEKDKL